MWWKNNSSFTRVFHFKLFSEHLAYSASIYETEIKGLKGMPLQYLISSKISGFSRSLCFIRSFIAVIMLFALSSAPCFELFSAAPEIYRRKRLSTGNGAIVNASMKWIATASCTYSNFFQAQQGYERWMDVSIQ